MLKLSAALGMSLAMPAWCARAGQPPASLSALLDRQLALFMARYPENATLYGYDIGTQADLRGQLGDRSAARMRQDRSALQSALRQLHQIDPQRLSKTDRLSYEVAEYVYQSGIDALAWYGQVDIDLRPTPYVVNQMNGAYYWLPEFLMNNHPVQDRQDLAYFIDRVAQLATLVDQETARVNDDAARGVIAPSFVIDKTIAQLGDTVSRDTLATYWVQPALQASRQLADPAFAMRLTRALDDHLRPALARQADALARLRPRADATAGVWHLPDGDAYYRMALSSNITDQVDPAELHQFGLDKFHDIQHELDLQLRKIGNTHGSVALRLQTLQEDQRYRVTDDDAGRQRILDYVKARIADVENRLGTMFHPYRLGELVVRRMSETIEASSPTANYSPGGENSPGVFAVNLYQPSVLPLWKLPTLIYHESIPGHHFQDSVVRGAQGLSAFRKVARFSAYTEGWALYAEQLAAEMGVYENEEAGYVGHLQSELFRAARIVVDSGIHLKRWDREQAIDWMVQNAGETRLESSREIDRYCVYPGQACSFLMGASAINTLRDARRYSEGASFDVRDFHRDILESGPMPLTVMKRQLGRKDPSP
ncbi:MAG: DUF885 domain-containing protein [Pseudomonas sp.]